MMTTGSDRLVTAETILGYTFSDRSLLKTALTHPSHATEHGGQNNERLEFLGDSLLGFIVAEEIFRAHPEAPEGVLTNRKTGVVAGTTLSAVAGEIGLGSLLRLGKGEARSLDRGRESRLENALEALIGAVYLDGGLESARGVVRRLLGEAIASETGIVQAGGAKSLLQEHTQGVLGVLPEYRLVCEEGDPHDRTFAVEVLVGGVVRGTASGRSKKEAEKAAAEAALTSLGVLRTGE
jgi:ribonuclease-3